MMIWFVLYENAYMVYISSPRNNNTCWLIPALCSRTLVHVYEGKPKNEAIGRLQVLYPISDPKKKNHNIDNIMIDIVRWKKEDHVYEPIK